MEDNHKTYDKATLAFQQLSPLEGEINVVSFHEDIASMQME